MPLSLLEFDEDWWSCLRYVDVFTAIQGDQIPSSRGSEVEKWLIVGCCKKRKSFDERRALTLFRGGREVTDEP